MKIQKLSFIFLGLAVSFSQLVHADTMLDGYWKLDVSQSVKCVNNQSVSATDAKEYLEKYEQLFLHLSNLQAVKYWTTEDGESIASPVFALTEVNPNKEYVLKHTGTSIPDATLILLSNGDLEYRSQDFEWNLCRGSQYRVIFKYLRLNP